MEVARQVRWPGMLWPNSRFRSGLWLCPSFSCSGTQHPLALSQSFLLRDPASFGCLLPLHQQLEGLVVNSYSLITSFIRTGHQASLFLSVRASLLYPKTHYTKSHWVRKVPGRFRFKSMPFKFGVFFPPF